MPIKGSVVLFGHVYKCFGHLSHLAFFVRFGPLGPSKYQICVGHQVSVGSVIN